jgi:peptide/nickel transport system substrate-binding protein
MRPYSMTLWATILAGTMILAGCAGGPDGGGGANADVDETPVQGDWMVLAREGEPDSLNPIVGTNAYSSEMWNAALGSFIGESLLGYDPETWNFDRPILAESYPDISEDHLTYTFTIRDGVQWHDGEPFTVDDVLFSIKAIMLPSVDSAHARGYFADLSEVSVDRENRQITFHMAQPYFLNADVLGGTLDIVPEHVYDPEGVLRDYDYSEIIATTLTSNPELRDWGLAFNRHPANRAPVGTGPFRFMSWDAGTQIVLRRNDEYWGNPAWLDGVVVRFITDRTAALTALKAGEVDMFPRLTPIQWAEQVSGADFNRRFKKTTFTIPNMAYIGWNIDTPFFNDKRVRQAMTMLVPREQFITTVMRGLGTTATGPINPGSRDFNSEIEPWPYDPERAAELLDEAGWVDTNGNGVRDKDGVEFRFEFSSSIGSSTAPQLMAVMKDELSKVGIEMTERVLEFTTLVQNARDHRYDALTMAWVSDLTQDLYQIWHSDSIANRGSNYVSYSNPEVDRLIEATRLEFDDERRRELFWEIQEILHEDQPYTFWYYPEDAAAYSNRFRGDEWLPARPGFDLTQWYVPAELQRFTDFTPE